MDELARDGAPRRDHGEVGMLLAVVGTLLRTKWSITMDPVAPGHRLRDRRAPRILMPMTAVPQRTALSQACGALAVGLVGTAEYYQSLTTPHGIHDGRAGRRNAARLPHHHRQASWRSANCTRSLPTRPITIKGQNFVNLALFAVAVGVRLVLVDRDRERRSSFPIFVGLALIFGVLLIIPIGGADMPTVIALLNSYAGLLGLRHGIRAGQQAADHRRRARRIVRLHSLDHHVQGHEPLVHQRAVRRLRTGADRPPQGAAEARPVRSRHPRRSRRDS